ncbi:MAG: DSD1 family PLP-dependent enzyme, partial [Gemmatimonadetes bacterium]|nr:DSD1 family PLP-dependent enzyme [Gemmatimonadota bacterium]
ITDIQCGSYIFMDGDYLEVLDGFLPALTVLATVISRPAPDRAVLDAGRKSVSIDRGMPKVVGITGAEVAGLSEEHTKVQLSGDALGLRVGQKVHVLPMHGDTTIAMHSHYFVVRERKLETVVEIAGRGCFT